MSPCAGAIACGFRPELIIRQTAILWRAGSSGILREVAGSNPPEPYGLPNVYAIAEEHGARSCSRACFLIAEVSTAPKFIHPAARRYRLEKVQGGAAGHPERRCRLFRCPARSSASRDAAGLHYRLGHSHPDPLCRAFGTCRGRLSGTARSVSKGAAEGEDRTADRHPELGFRGALCR